jgi:hypothetical protein
MRPWNKEELFNLCHASLWNAIEHIFGVLKWWFQILIIAPEYNLEVQAQISVALCAIHNFIQEHDPNEGELEERRDMFDEDSGNDGMPTMPTPKSKTVVTSSLRNQIAQDMWNQYQEVLTERGMLEDEASEENETDTNIND